MDETAAREEPLRSIGTAEFIALSAALMSLNAMAIDIMLPGLQQIGAALGVAEENHRQFVITAYVVGLGVAQLFFGPISDRFGRRGPLMTGLILYLVAAIAAAFAPSFALLLVLRFLQGVGAAATRVIAVSAIRDVFGGRRMAEVLSMVMMVFMVIPVMAPSLGQLIMIFGSWPEIFLAMGGLALAVTIWVWLRLPETLPPSMRRALSVRVVAEGFGYVVTNRVAFCYMLAAMAIFGALFGFINSAQQIYVDIYGLGTWFPLLFAVGAGLMALSSFTNSRLVGRLGMRRLSHGALLSFIALNALWLVLSLMGPMPFPLFFLLFSASMFMFGWIGPNFNSIAMEPLGHVAGTAAAVLGFVTTLGGGVLGALIGQAFDGTLTPLAGGYFAVSVAGLILVLIGERGRLFHAVNPPV
ncbi:multidrug effflux MFS transporter [Chelativorans intermedius]|uniref:Bcr/CflA family efflux transporter n=1 Tax=Chelativorans intermedius TaxID=515947 RepID=A0ABV6D6F9_9HYPH|nr:multidrug effflux MFS transporter [Chelativorans intermedius]MCT8999476.1 multidrug effflux MFS transporter [Chelativorans intermedius]